MIGTERVVYNVMSIWAFEWYVKDYLDINIVDVLEEFGGAKDIRIGSLIEQGISKSIAFEFNITQDKLDVHGDNLSYDSKTEYYLYSLCSKGLIQPGKYLLNSIIEVL